METRVAPRQEVANGKAPEGDEERLREGIQQMHGMNLAAHEKGDIGAGERKRGRQAQHVDLHRDIPADAPKAGAMTPMEASSRAATVSAQWSGFGSPVTDSNEARFITGQSPMTRQKNPWASAAKTGSRDKPAGAGAGSVAGIWAGAMLTGTFPERRATFLEARPSGRSSPSRDSATFASTASAGNSRMQAWPYGHWLSRR